MNVNPLKVKLKNALRIDRALRFVWQAGAKWTAASAVLIVIQGVLPLLSLYLIKLIIDSVAALILSNGNGLTMGLEIGSTITEKAGSEGTSGFISGLLSGSGFCDATGMGEGFSLVVLYIVLAGGAGLLTALCSFFSDYVKKAQSLTITDYMFSVLHEKSVSVDLAFYESPEYRDTLHRAQREGPYRPTSIVNGLVQTGQSGASLIAVMGLLVLFNPLLPLVMFAAVVPGVFMRLKYSDKIYSWQKKRTEDERKANYFNWMITGEAHAREFRLFGLGEHFIERFKGIRDILRDEKLWFEKRRAFGDLIARSSATITVFGAFIYIAAKTVQGSITIGDMVMYFQAFQKGLAYLSSLFDGAASLYEDNLFLSNFYEFLDIKPVVNDPEPEYVKKVIKNGHEVDFSALKQGGCVKKVIKNGFKMENVTFNYQYCVKNVIDCLNLHIHHNEVVALVGENGSGKSTIVKLLCRLYDPTAGTVQFNETDIKKIKVKDYRKKISVVFQDYIRYYLTARENIWLGDIDLDKENHRIAQAAGKAGIKKYIDTLPLKFETPLGKWFQGGEELSVGQWQMMALARAFFRNADLVILDEPASSLDVNSEFEVFKKFRKLVKDKSALIISHRFSTVKMADKILLLQDGKIIENGSHDELMKIDGKYADLFRKQADQYN